MIPETPPGRLADFLIGDLAVATRHLDRLMSGKFDGASPQVLAMVYRETAQSIARCIERINRDIPTA